MSEQQDRLDHQDSVAQNYDRPPQPSGEGPYRAVKYTIKHGDEWGVSDGEEVIGVFTGEESARVAAEACNLVAGRSRDAGGMGEVAEMLAAIDGLMGVLVETLDDWDADRDSRVGKRLKALAGFSEGYHPDIDRFHKARAALSAAKISGGTT